MTNFIVLSLLVVLQVLGNISLGRGIRQIGEVNTLNPSALLAFGIDVLTNPWVVLGIAFLIVCLILYLVAISRLDLSYVLPMTASTYMLATLCAWLLLGERISATRWAGTFVVTIGVLLVGLGERSELTRKPARRKRTNSSRHRR